MKKQQQNPQGLRTLSSFILWFATCINFFTGSFGPPPINRPGQRPVDQVARWSFGPKSPEFVSFRGTSWIIAKRNQSNVRLLCWIL